MSDQIEIFLTAWSIRSRNLEMEVEEDNLNSELDAYEQKHMASRKQIQVYKHFTLVDCGTNAICDLCESNAKFKVRQ